MKILFISPGSGDTYFCCNCYRDNLYAQALRRMGHEVVFMPLYMPVDYVQKPKDMPLFFSATSYYVASQLWKNRPLPKLLKRMLSAKPLLWLASRYSGTTSPKGLERLTLSMIKGNNPAFEEEVQQLIQWIKKDGIPDVIHLSSSLLIGVAPHLKKGLKVPLVCSLQDEEVWIDSMSPQYIAKAWEGIQSQQNYVDSFVTVSNYYRAFVEKRFPSFPAIDVIYPGVNLERYVTTELPSDPTIGFFYRMNKLNGLDKLVDAFVLLKKRKTIPRLKLKIAGGYNFLDRSFVEEMRKRLAPFSTDVEINSNYDVQRHPDFFKQVSVVSVPVTFNEGVGLYICESFAAGRPVVQPHSGSHQEIVGEAGLLYSPNEPKALADALERILLSTDLYQYSHKKALNCAITRYNDKLTAESLVKLYIKTKYETL